MLPTPRTVLPGGGPGFQPWPRRPRPGPRPCTGITAPIAVRSGARLLAARLALVLAVVACARPAAAHPAPFSYLDLHIGPTGIEGSLIVHDFDVAHDLGIDPPGALLEVDVARAAQGTLIDLMEHRLHITADGAPLDIEWGGIDVLRDRQSLRLAFTAGRSRPARLDLTARLFPYDPVHQTFVNVYEDGALVHQAILNDERTTLVYYAGTLQGAGAVVATFIPAGIEHILIGPDHILFLIGLLLLGGSPLRLAGIVSAFTLGHSVTLSLASLGLVSPPASIVEPTIALSIVFVGVDNLLVGQSRARDIRAYVAAVFGLVHGFGFASVLRELGLPQSALGWSLFSFNVGVELGQLGIVLVVATGLELIRRRNPATARQIAMAGSIGVILAGGYWFAERVFLTGGA